LQSIELPHQNGGFDIVDPALFLQSHSDIINGLYEDVKQGMQINKWMIRGMHSALTEFQDFAPGIDLSGRRKRIPLRKGQFKIWPNNPTRSDGLLHQYCPPDQVESEIDNLMRMHKEHNAKNVPIDVEAAWFHHRFVQIHPFQDGNGRMARALASLIFIERGYLPPVVTNIGKPAYIDALDAANTGNLKPFVDYLALLVVNKTRQCIRLYQDAKDELAGNPTKPGSPKPR
jgi:hypothetical protein